MLETVDPDEIYNLGAQSHVESLIRCSRNTPPMLNMGIRSWSRRSLDRILWRAEWLRWEIWMRTTNGLCSVEIACPGIGFFAQMTWCLYILEYCERHRLIPDIRLTAVYTDPGKGSNWLDYYFNRYPTINADELASRLHYTVKIDHHRGPPVRPRLNIDEAALVFRKYLEPKPHITQLVESFWNGLNVSGPILGVHYRGTDKFGEASRVPWQHCLDIINKYVEENRISAVFAASDEQAFVDWLKHSVQSTPVYFRNDHYRGLDIRPIHTEIEGNGYAKGEDALVNALLLAKCSMVVRTTSFLSAWASIFNPNLRVILLNKPHRHNLWYPETEILRTASTECMPCARSEPSR